MKKITLLLVLALMTAMNAMSSTKIDLTTHAFSSWGADKCTVNGTTLTFLAAWGGAGCWLGDGTGTHGGADFSEYDYLWIKLKSCTCSFNLVTQYVGSTLDTDGVSYKIDDNYTKTASGKADDIIVGVALNADHSDAFAQFYIQAKEIGVVDIDEAYLGTEEEYNAALAGNKPQTSNLSLTDLGSGWGNSTYNAETKTITIGDDWSGKGWWLNDVDYSDFDNVVVDFASATTINGKVVVKYVDESNNGEEGAFSEGTTEVICPLSSQKNHVKQIYIQGPAGSTYTLSAAYLATTASTPTAIKNAESENDVIGTQYFNVAGQQSDKLAKGLNIVKKQLTNGKFTTEKVLVK